LHLAAGEEHLEVVTLLLSRGADPGVRDRWGHAPLDGCSHDGPCEKALVEAGAPPRRMDGSDGDKTPRDGGCEFITDPQDVEMLERLGGGSFGVVYRATWRGTPVAAKCLRATAGNSEDEALALKDFHNEATVLFRLRHPNIATLLAYSDAPGKEILVSELMRGSVLDRLRVLGDGRYLQKPKALRWATELCRGMAYLHSRRPPVLHRDLKPGNLLLDSNDSIKITDFGLATIRVASTESKSPGPDSPEDLTGTTGSFRFMAPEVAASKPYGRPVDVYSFAMILYNLYASEPPWRGESGESAARHGIRGERPTLPRSWDQKVVDLIRNCWAHEPAARPSFLAILDLLDELATAGLVEQDTAVVPSAKQCCVVS
jgi:serine/threonine protein kinase